MVEVGDEEGRGLRPARRVKSLPAIHGALGIRVTADGDGAERDPASAGP